MPKTRQEVYNDKRWWPLRQKVLRLAGHRCSHCGASITGKGKARIDHIKSVESRPDLAYVESNLRALCVPCDNARHSEKGGGRAIGRQQLGADGWPVDDFG
jgi:5-methylcytosine-specific restriction endonuclease McrA